MIKRMNKKFLDEESFFKPPKWDNMLRSFWSNKKGAEMTIGTIVIIILALVVLAILIYGFGYGWGNFWRDLTGLGGGRVNVQTIVNSCQIACSTNQFYEYCTKTRNVYFDEKQKDAIPMNCDALAKDTARNTGLSCTNIDCNVNPQAGNPANPPLDAGVPPTQPPAAP